MSRQGAVEAPADERRDLFQGVVLIVLAGILLGTVHNFLGLRGQPARGLAWISAPKMLDSLENAQTAAKTPTSAEPTSTEQGKGSPAEATKPNPGTTTQPSPPPQSPKARFTDPNSDDPLGLGAAAAPDDLLQVPDVGRPLQVQLVAVKRFHDARAALFVDAREPDEFVAGHIPGSINLPFDQSVTDPEKLANLDSGGRPIIAYCGGGTCEVSMTLAESLVQAGHRRVLVFMGGFPEWEKAGYPVEKGGGA
jgi:rhodanese-related sulfurtransferase